MLVRLLSSGYRVPTAAPLLGQSSRVQYWT